MTQEFENFPYEIKEVNGKRYAVITLCTWEQLREAIALEFNFTLQLQKEDVSDYRLSKESEEFFSSVLESIPVVAEQENVEIEDIIKRYLCQAFFYGLLIGKTSK